MRVAVVHSFYASGLPSGENAVVLDQVAQLQEGGHDVTLVSRHTDDHVDERLYAARAAMTTMTGRGPSPERTLADLAPDVVHLHNTFPNWGTRWLRTWGPRTVLTLHNYRTVCSNGDLFRDGHDCDECLSTPVLPALRHRCYRGSTLATVPLALGSSPVGALRRVPRSVARVVALNEEAGAIYSRAFGRDVDVVPNSIAAGPRLPEPTRGWLYVGRLSPDKGIEELLAHWPADQPLDIVGDGPQVHLARAAATANPHITYHGPLPRHDVLRMIAEAVGVVVPSLAENLPTVLLEAIASGVPLVLSDQIHATPEFAEAGAARVICHEDGPTGLAAALEDVLADRPRMREAAIRLHAERYSPQVWLERMEAIYRSVAGTSLSPV